MENKAAARVSSPARRNGAAEDHEEAPQAATFSVSVTRRRKVERATAPRSATPREEQPREAKPAATGVARYLEVLGVGPNASFDAINTAYYTLIKRFPQNPTEEDEARLQEVKRAYDILKRNYQPKEEKSFHFAFDKRVALPLLGVTAVMMLAGLVALNWKNLRLKMIHYEQGTVVALKGHGEPYGRITGYESMHHFPAGNPSAAYEMKLDGRETTVWVSERLVVNGMQPLRSK
ncbi:MAG TPA: J domain-containing protein [Candidatus Polarisedimenticolia bacterium]|nr:J domain-containing protein [Candidatus Polarisedimenticolia bacterium]